MLVLYLIIINLILDLIIIPVLPAHLTPWIWPTPVPHPAHCAHSVSLLGSRVWADKIIIKSPCASDCRGSEVITLEIVTVFVLVCLQILQIFIRNVPELFIYALVVGNWEVVLEFYWSGRGFWPGFWTFSQGARFIVGVGLGVDGRDVEGVVGCVVVLGGVPLVSLGEVILEFLLGWWDSEGGRVLRLLRVLIAFL